MPSRDLHLSPADSSQWRDVQRLLRDDRWSEAVEVLRHLAAESDSPEARLILGALLAASEHYHEAIQLWTGVIDHAHRDNDRSLLAAAYSHLAAVYRAVEDFDLARRFQRCAQQLDDGAEALRPTQAVRWLALQMLDPRRN